MNLEALMIEFNRLKARLEELERKQPEVGRWMTWTPTVTQSVGVTVTINYARYIIVSSLVVVQVRLTTTSAGTVGNDIIIGGQPVTIQPANSGNPQDVLGTFLVVDTSAPNLRYHGALVALAATGWRGIAHNTTNGIGTTPNFALASGDLIGIQAAYERA